MRITAKTIFTFLFSFFLLTISIIAVAKSETSAPGYSIIWLWPFSFLICYMFLLSRIKLLGIHKIAVYMLVYYRFLMKYAIYPLLVSLAGSTYVNAATYLISITASDIVLGILYGVFELVVVSVFLYFFELFIYRKYKKMNIGRSLLGSKDDCLSLTGPFFIYPVILLIGLALFFLVGIPNHLVGFLRIDNYSEDISKPFLIVRYLIIACLALGTMSIFYLFSIRKNKIFGLLVSLFAAILFVCVIQSGSRASQLYVALIMMSILCVVFPNHRKIIVLFIGLAFGSVLIGLTLTREGLDSGWFSGDLNLLAQKFQIYFGGPSSIMTSIKVLTEYENITILNLVYDHLDVFPLSLFLNGHSTSEIYNLAIYEGTSSSGQVIFTTSYGYLFFGFLGIPFSMIVNILVCTFFNKLFYKAKTYETKYMFGYCLFRSTSGLLVNLPSIISGIFQYIFLFLAIIVLIRLFFSKEGIKLKWAKSTDF